MKYLKLFEGVNNSFFELSEREFGELVHGKEIPINYVMDKWDFFTENDIESISSLNPILNLVKSHHYTSNDKRKIKYYSLYININNNILSEIFKLKDEWYVIHISNFSSSYEGKEKYYKCDQLDGLIDCIKKEILQ